MFMLFARCRCSEFVRQNGFQPPANFPAVIGPDPRAPITEITALRAKQMKQRITIALLVGRNSRFEHFLVEMRTGLLHWTQKFFVAAHPGDVVRPTAAFHVEAIVLLFNSSMTSASFSDPSPGGKRSQICFWNNGCTGGKSFSPTPAAARCSRYSVTFMAGVSDPEHS